MRTRRCLALSQADPPAHRAPSPGLRPQLPASFSCLFLRRSGNCNQEARSSNRIDLKLSTKGVYALAHASQPVAFVEYSAAPVVLNGQHYFVIGFLKRNQIGRA